MSFRRIIGLIAAFAVVVGLSYVGRPGSADATPPLTPAPAADLTELNRLIGVHAARAPERLESLEFRTLGDLYTERADQTSNLGDYRLALDAYGRAVAIDPEDITSRLSLATAALTLHEFADAATLAEQLVTDAPGDPSVLALAGDVALERGDYQRAADLFSALDAAVLAATSNRDPAVTVRLANLAYLTGDTAEAMRLADIAVRQSASFRPADRAFYEALAGSIAFLTGDLKGAEAHHEVAVALTPTDQGALGELSRVRAALGDYASAIALLEEANRIFPEPDHLTRLADLYLITGTATTATIESLYAQGMALATLDADHERSWARIRAQFLLDHDRDVDEALAIAEQDLGLRADVGGWDLYAWALLANGEPESARAASDRALALGTPNAAFWYHAGAISAELGDTERAIAELERALSLNPGFEPIHAAEAAALLDSLK